VFRDYERTGHNEAYIDVVMFVFSLKVGNSTIYMLRASEVAALTGGHITVRNVNVRKILRFLLPNTIGFSYRVPSYFLFRSCTVIFALVLKGIRWPPGGPMSIGSVTVMRFTLSKPMKRRGDA